MKVPYISLDRQFIELKDRIIPAITRVLEAGDFVLGEALREFESRFADYCGVRYAVGVNSGTDALTLILKGYGIGSGDEVITVPNTFIATVSAIVLVGAKPVFADVGEDFNLDPEKFRSVVTERTRAVIPVHLSGAPADMNEILEIACNTGIKVIEDAAQAVGTIYLSKHTGALGDAAAFSLHPLKTLNASGDGGIITTNDEELYISLLQARNLGMRERNRCEIFSGNSRLDTLQAAILLEKLKYLEEWIDRRRSNAEIYRKRLAEYVELPVEREGCRHSYHTFVVRSGQRDRLMDFLQAAGVECKIHYPLPVHLQPAASHLGYSKGSFPVAERYADEILTLPIHQYLRSDELNYVCEVLERFFSGKQV